MTAGRSSGSGTAGSAVKTRRRRRTLAIITASLVIVVVAYVAAAAVVWDRLTAVRGACPDEQAANRPSSFSVPGRASFDPSRWEAPEPEDVRFPSREPSIDVAGWWIPAREPEAEAVIVVHGLNGCRRHHEVLLPAGMLHRAGFSVLLIDLRDHGDSTREDGRFAGGTDEYRDVLGAWDWLVETHGLAPAQIGLAGISMGAGSVMIATGEEPRVAAVWEDSGYSDVSAAIRAELARGGYPEFLAWGGVLMARVISGDDLGSLSPLAAARKLDGRPLFVTHGTADSRLSVAYAHELVGAVRAEGGAVDHWIVAGAGHVEAMLRDPMGYEARLSRFFRESLVQREPGPSVWHGTDS